jgi:hypothetical protein
MCTRKTAKADPPLHGFGRRWSDANCYALSVMFVPPSVWLRRFDIGMEKAAFARPDVNNTGVSADVVDGFRRHIDAHNDIIAQASFRNTGPGKRLVRALQF